MIKIELNPDMRPYNHMPNTSVLVQMGDKKEYDELDFMFSKHIHAFKAGSEYSSYIRTFSVFSVRDTSIYVEHNDGVTNIYTEDEFTETFTVIDGHSEVSKLPTWVTLTIMTAALSIVIISLIRVL